MRSIVAFREKRRWGNTKNFLKWKEKLPMVAVTVQGRDGLSSVNLMAIVDTGAQYLFIPAEFARDLGIDLSMCKYDKVIIASGEERKLRYTNVDIVVRGVRANAFAFFGEGWLTLLGLESIYATMVFGVDQTGSLYGKPRRSGGFLSEIVRYFVGT